MPAIFTVHQRSKDGSWKNTKQAGVILEIFFFIEIKINIQRQKLGQNHGAVCQKHVPVNLP